MSGGIGSVGECHEVHNAPGGIPEQRSGAGTVHHSGLEFRPLPTAVPCARLHTKNVLAEWDLSSIACDAELVVSELVTNAYEASSRAEKHFPDKPTIALRLSADDRLLTVEVWDRSPADPVVTPTEGDTEHGRGLMMVEAFSHDWGFYRTSEYLKTVWAQLVIPSPSTFTP